MLLPAGCLHHPRQSSCRSATPVAITCACLEVAAALFPAPEARLSGLGFVAEAREADLGEHFLQISAQALALGSPFG
jgi:hypothetical protein